LAETLKPAHAHLIRRVDVDGASVPEVASEEGITRNNAAVRLHRARAALRNKLKLVCGACARHGCLDCGCPRRRGL
jgi:RNA polymerase sigma-70 factor (ECF subfamily)